jgi:hypothetical protein
VSIAGGRIRVAGRAAFDMDVERDRHRARIALVRVVCAVGTVGDRHQRLILRHDRVGNPVIFLGRTQVEMKGALGNHRGD